MFLSYMSDVRGREVINFAWAYPEARNSNKTNDARQVTYYTNLAHGGQRSYTLSVECIWVEQHAKHCLFIPLDYQILPRPPRLSPVLLCCQRRPWWWGVKNNHICFLLAWMCTFQSAGLKPNFGCNIDSGINMHTRLSFYSLHETQIYYLWKST